MKYFEALMVERLREGIVRINGEIAALDIEIANLPKRRWFKKRQLKQYRKDLKQMVKSSESLIASKS